MKKVIYYENDRGEKHVKEFIDRFNDKIKGRILARIEYVGEHWHEIGRPIIDYLGDDLYEIRISFAHNKIRVIYAYMLKDYIVLLHAIIKKTSEIPENDKLKAKNRRIDFQIRYNEGKIRLP